MVETKCPHCGNKWDYKGNMKYYANCPDCRKPVLIRKKQPRGNDGST